MEYIEREALIAAYDAAHKGEPGGAKLKQSISAPTAREEVTADGWNKQAEW